MKPKTMALMLVAVVCGLGASYMTSKLLADRQSTSETENEKVMVLVAKKNLDMGLFIKNGADLFVEKAYIKGEEPNNAIMTVDQLKDRQLKRALRTGDFVTSADLIDQNSSLLQGQLPAGHRAIGMQVRMESIAGGWATLPGSRVDVISTIKRPDDKTSFAQILLQNVLVLGVDTAIHRDAEGRAMPGSVCIVALKPEDMLKLTIAKEYGQLSLALRGFGENKQIDVGKATYDGVVNPTHSGGQEDPSANSGNELASIGQPPVALTLPPLLPVNEVTPTPEAKEEQDLHTIRIIEGDRERRVNFVLDKTGNVLRNDVGSTPVVSPPLAVEVTPPAPAQPKDVNRQGNKKNNSPME
jgi:pilus assembly protein CpaB